MPISPASPWAWHTAPAIEAEFNQKYWTVSLQLGRNLYEQKPLFNNRSSVGLCER